MIYLCCEEGRRSLVHGHATLNGIERLEVVDQELIGTPQESLRQRILRLFFISKAVTSDPMARQAFFNRLATLSSTQVNIHGGERLQQITVESVGLRSATNVLLHSGDRTELIVGDHLEIRVSTRGDFSLYTLKLVEASSDSPLLGLDDRLSRIDFSFKVECESEFDCRPNCGCPPRLASSPDLDYMAKDYASFRKLMLDRMAFLAPEWRERNPADLGVTLVEILAYVGDYLSYRQDAIATEAYLGTARHRVSVKRHARLLDYAMHDGCNARAWVQVRLKPEASKMKLEVGADVLPPLRFATRLSSSTLLAEPDFQTLFQSNRAVVFEPMESAELFPEHNELPFHTWGDDACCLAKGAIKATLRGDLPNLQPGQVLIFVEQLGPQTGHYADADPLHRHAVRLTKINGMNRQEYLFAAKNNTLPQRLDELTVPPTSVTDIEWGDADALPIPFSLSVRARSDGRLLEDVSVALGNIVLADQGMTLPHLEELGQVPTPNLALASVGATGCDHCETPSSPTIVARFRPLLKNRPLTRAANYDPEATATAAFAWTMNDVLPSIHLADSQGRQWNPKRDLLSSGAFASEFVAETDNDDRTNIRFGDDENGMHPSEGTLIHACYRIGNGTTGNLPMGAIVHVVSDTFSSDEIQSVSNPLSARGGTDPEPMEAVRQNAPAAFRIQQRAVTPEDYAAKAGEHPDVQRAAATLRWSGSWHTVFLTIDRRSSRLVDAAFENELRVFLERYRLAGHDLEIDGPRFVPLELALRVCISSNYFRSDVIAALKAVFDNRLHSDGTRGFFHAENFSFGQPVLLSRIYAAAQQVAGVRHVEVTILRRQGATTDALVPESDVFEVGRIEIAQLENDSNFPDRGVLRFEALGGR